jgi:cytoskeletal protein CcmA (bactofilin family)
MNMKSSYKLITLLLLLAFLVMPTGSVLAKGIEDGKVVFGDSYTLASGDTLSGDLVVFGGAVEVQTDATVEGSVVVMGGSMQVDGTVEKDVVMIGGTVSLGTNAVVNGDVVTVGGSLQQADGAVIKGEIINTTASNFNIGNGAVIPPLTKIPFAIEPLKTPFAPESPHFDFNFNPLRAALNIFGQAFLMALLAALVVAFIPMPTQRIAQAVSTQPLVAGGLGCLTLLVAPVALIFLALLTLTVILAPLTISLIGIGTILLAVALLFGEIAIGLEVGQRLVKSFHAEWPLPLSAAMGTFLTVFVVSAISSLLWCLGWWAPFLLALLAVGGVLMTRFGTRMALPPTAPVSAPIVPATPPDAPLPPTS